MDRYFYKKVLLADLLFGCIFAYTLPLVSKSAICFLIWFTALGTCERGLYAIVAPILIKLYGLKIGSKLFPIKATSFLVALILVPAFQMVLLSFLTFDQILFILSFFIVISIILVS